MVLVETNKIYCIYVRTNRHIQWKYATYGGRYETPEKAIEEARKHCDAGTEYLIEDIEGKLITTGFIC